MHVLGTDVPVSAWTGLALVLGTGVTTASSRPLAGALGWHHRWTLAALVALAVVAALTVTPNSSHPPLGLAACIPIDLADVPVDIEASGGGAGGVALNVALFVPAATAVVLAAGRLRPLLGVALLPAAVELAQTVLPGRSCAITDALANLAGVLVGAAIGWVALRRRRVPRVDDDPVPAPR